LNTHRREDFRPEIEGLRALAVGAVVLHHAFPALLPGGFAGVDIFFVVSGYVIGQGLIAAFDRRNFGFMSFWTRRARRLFPALALVMLVVWGLGSLVLMPAELASVGRQMLAASLFGNNVLLVGESGYFAPAASSHPLLHLWSLGIEEQFYLLAPCLLWLGAASGGRTMAWVYRACAASLLWTIVFAGLDEVSSFYLLHTRFWELGAGLALAHAHVTAAAGSAGARPGPLTAAGLGPWEVRCWLLVLVFAAVLQLLHTPPGAGHSQALSIGGLLVVLLGSALALHRMDPGPHPRRAGVPVVLRRHRGLTGVASRCALRHSPFGRPGGLMGLAVLCLACGGASAHAWPGAQTVWPVVGALLVIGGGATGVAGRLLSSRPALFLGGISYPLYLWHWPLLVYLRLFRPEPSALELVAVVLLAVVLAFLTERWVERPMRFGQWGALRFPRPAVRWGVGAMVGVGILGVSTERGQGFAGRAPAGVRDLAEWSAPGVWDDYRAGTCFHFLTQQNRFDATCTPARSAGRPWVLLWGDSHAAHLYPGIGPWARSRGVDLAQWTTGSCAPTWLRLRAEGPACPSKSAMAQDMLSAQRPDLVVLAAAWGLYLDGDGESQIDRAVADSARRLQALGVRDIVLFGPGPRWNTSLPADLYRHMLRHRSQPLPQRLPAVDDRLRRLDATLAATARRFGLHYVSVLQHLCNDQGCLTVADPTQARPDLLYWDRDHFTVSGSSLLVGKAAATLDAALNRQP
jgi:peptidoglycan/LPS O-acetylase OafA/YrhL